MPVSRNHSRQCQRRTVAQANALARCSHHRQPSSQPARQKKFLNIGSLPESAIAIETSWGALVKALLEYGFAVFSINPKQIDLPDIIRLRELSKFEEELKAELRRTTNRLWQQLHRYYPQALQLSPAADDLFIWDLLRNAPNPASALKLSLARIRKLLGSHRISTFTAEEVQNILGASALQLAEGAAYFHRRQ